MLGGVLCLHFGVFDLLSLGWRTLGIAAAPLMRAPHRAVSLSSFWGERWNHAFHILIANYIFRPVARRAGPAVALWAGFAVSGLVHDAVISVPARAGYGFPTLYFLVQALGIILERGRFVRSIDRDDNRRRHFLTLAWVAAPAGLLFTKPFVREVILPFLHALRAI
jgi:alginate O-acetyltransferase complex protein AlgI